MSHALALIGPSVSAPVTTTAYSFQPDADSYDSNPQDTPTSWRVRCISDTSFHISTTGEATTNDAMVEAGFPGIIVAVPPGGEISVILKATASPGTAWFTRVKAA